MKKIWDKKSILNFSRQAYNAKVQTATHFLEFFDFLSCAVFWAEILILFYLRLINKKCAKEKKHQYLTLHQNWYRTPVYFELAVSASYASKCFSFKVVSYAKMRIQRSNKEILEFLKRI